MQRGEYGCRGESSGIACKPHVSAYIACIGLHRIACKPILVMAVRSLKRLGKSMLLEKLTSLLAYSSLLVYLGLTLLVHEAFLLRPYATSA